MGGHDKLRHHQWGARRGFLWGTGEVCYRSRLQEWVFLLVVNRDHSSKLLSFWRQKDEQTNGQTEGQCYRVKPVLITILGLLTF